MNFPVKSHKPPYSQAELQIKPVLKEKRTITQGQ